MWVVSVTQPGAPVQMVCERPLPGRRSGEGAEWSGRMIDPTHDSLQERGEVRRILSKLKSA